MSDDELLAVKTELESKKFEIARLRSENAQIVKFFEDRLNALNEQLAANSLANQIKHGETASVEFKSSLRWNLMAERFDKDIENEVLKTIVAFCNTSGGELFIGVADNGNVVGIAHDAFASDDKFQLHLRNLLAARVVPPVAQMVRYEMATIDGKTICHVTCQASKKHEIWLKPENDAREHFYVRIRAFVDRITAP